MLIDLVCDGDCDRNGAVSVAELIRAVNIALDLVAADICVAADADASGNVEIADLIRAVNRALYGCLSESGTSD